jgi:hypothetical protein
MRGLKGSNSLRLLSMCVFTGTQYNQKISIIPIKAHKYIWGWVKTYCYHIGGIISTNQLCYCAILWYRIRVLTRPITTSISCLEPVGPIMCWWAGAAPNTLGWQWSGLAQPWTGLCRVVELDWHSTCLFLSNYFMYMCNLLLLLLLLLLYIYIYIFYYMMDHSNNYCHLCCYVLLLIFVWLCLLFFVGISLLSLTK